LLETRDGGQTWSTVATVAGEVFDAAWDGQTLWIVLNGLELLPVTDAGLGMPTADFPYSVGIGTLGDVLYAAPESYLVGPLLSRATASGSFETLAYPDDIAGPLACPAGSTVGEVCEPLWEVLLPKIRGFDPPELDTAADTGRTPADEPGPRKSTGTGCRCETSRAPAWLALLAVRRR
jgi:hypothetical protein